MAKRKNTTNPYEKAYNKELQRIQRFLKGATNRGFIWIDNPVPDKPKKITQASVNRLKKLTPDVLYLKGEYIDEETGELLSGRMGRKLERKRATEKAKATREAKKNKSKQKPKKQKKQEQPKPTPEVQTEPTPVAPPELPDEAYDTEPEMAQRGAIVDKYAYPKYTSSILENVISMIESFTPPDYWSKNWQMEKARTKYVLLGIIESVINDDGRDAVAARLRGESSEQINEIIIAILYDSDGERVEFNINRLATILNGGPLSQVQSDLITELSEANEWWEMPK